MDLSIDNVYEILLHYHPLIYKNDLEWLEKGRIYANNNIEKYNNSIEAKFFMLNFYINNFKEEHLRLQLDRNILEYPLYPKIFAQYNGKILTVIMSKDKRIPKGISITHIDDKPFKNYLKKFIPYNNGSDDEPSDLIINSNILFLDYKNPFLPAPKKITIHGNNKPIILEYIECPQNCINKYSATYYETEDEFYISKNENDIIYLRIPKFEDVNFEYLKNLLPAKKIIIDLRDNLGGDVKYVEDFFYIVYGIKIKWGVTIKNSNLVNEYNYRNIKNNNKDNITTIKCSGPNLKEKINMPKLEIIVNEFSKSACRTFCQIALLYIKNVKINGKIKLYPICGNSILFETSQYRLYVPSSCYECKSLYPKIYNVEKNKVNNMLKKYIKN